MPSPAFDRFYESLRGGPDWRDFLDLPAFDECTNVEKDRIRADVRQRLATTADRRLVLAIPSLFPFNEALALLLATLARRARLVSTAAGQTLLGLVGSAVLYQVQQVEKASRDDLEARLDAFSVIDQIPGWHSTFYLVNFLDDPDVRVRSDVAGKIFVRLGLSKLPSDPLLGPRLLLRRLQSASTLIAKAAADELKRLVNTNPPYAFAAPQPYSPAFQAFIESLDPAKPAIDAAAAASLTGEERTSAIALLADHLYGGDAARATAALQQLASDPTCAALLAEHAAAASTTPAP
jgi:hypothetical protein